DHVIQDHKKFQRVLKDCLDLAAREDVLVTIGIRPTEPATGYGYIKEGCEVSFNLNVAKARTTFCHVDKFVEKPNLAKARRFLKSGQYRWNAGMFVWSVETVTRALEAYQPAMADALQRWKSVAGSPKKLAVQLTKDYPSVDRISIDFAVMEKAENTIVADGSFDWDDLGSWTALERHLKPDAQGNCQQAEFVQIDSNNNIVFDARTKQRQTIALVGIRDCIVVQTDDACMVASKSHGQQIKDLVQQLASDPRYKHLT
ncbi:MAG: mannose-1-phosphate guanyltransferase, partial [Verrucomicrobia bacterium]|nr:mannose-1-phosphate guanyltransferase [Verrucomicrobiota bacterium]